MKTRALLLLLVALLLAGVSRRIRARKRVAQKPVACAEVIGISFAEGWRLGCSSDPELSHCSDSHTSGSPNSGLPPGAIYDPHSCQRLVPLPGQVLLPRGKQLDLNLATATDFEALPGIGPSLARRIVAERAKRPFDSVDDLERVSGIGPKRIEAVAGGVRVKEH